ncbi:MAG: erythromycin esterase family protein [Deltaproteobacteria bacterium]|nr:erythromycin esterase family protein [Deltaproteobacteria bacterium]
MVVRFGLGLITLIGAAIVGAVALDRPPLSPSWRWIAASTGLMAFLLAGRKLYRDHYGPPPAEVVAYIGDHGISLVSVEAGNGFDDMAAISNLIGTARIVALGESTHGSREIFQLKHRMLEYLVSQQGFTVFAIEANQPECRAINQYVLHGTGNPKTALAGIQLWPWKTVEVLAMIEWMRAWNAGHDRKVQFTGFDMQFSDLAYETVASFVTNEVPDQATALLAPISILGAGTARAVTTLQKVSAKERTALQNGLAALGPALACADPDTRHDLQIMEQAATMYMEPTHRDARDRAMAENVGWLLDHTKARIVLWAHNSHISKTEPHLRSMGSHLRANYQQDYRTIGFVFGGGSFRAVDLSKPSRPIAEHTLCPPPESHASVAFARTRKPILVLDLRALPRGGTVASWFATPHAVREISAAFLDVKADTFRTVLPERFDAVIYLDKTTSSRPIEN